MHTLLQIHFLKIILNIFFTTWCIFYSKYIFFNYCAFFTALCAYFSKYKFNYFELFYNFVHILLQIILKKLLFILLPLHVQILLQIHFFLIIVIFLLQIHFLKYIMHLFTSSCACFTPNTF